MVGRLSATAVVVAAAVGIAVQGVLASTMPVHDSSYRPLTATTESGVVGEAVPTDRTGDSNRPGSGLAQQSKEQIRTRWSGGCPTTAGSASTRGKHLATRLDSDQCPRIDNKGGPQEGPARPAPNRLQV
jgi:hypothetical protein